jgi:hypothetical protein
MGSWLDRLGPGMMPVEGGGGYHRGSHCALPVSLHMLSATRDDTMTLMDPLLGAQVLILACSRQIVKYDVEQRTYV